MAGRLAAFHLDESGQAALEYLVIGLVLLAMIGALGAIWHFVADGGMSQVISASTSHALGTIGGALDVLSF